MLLSAVYFVLRTWQTLRKLGVPPTLSGLVWGWRIIATQRIWQMLLPFASLLLCCTSLMGWYFVTSAPSWLAWIDQASIWPVALNWILMGFALWLTSRSILPLLLWVSLTILASTGALTMIRLRSSPPTARPG